MVPEEGEKIHFYIFSTWTHLGRQGLPKELWRDFPKRFYMILTDSGTVLADYLKQKQTNQRKTLQEEIRETSGKSNEKQILPQQNRLARTCTNAIIKPKRGGGVGRSPLDNGIFGDFTASLG